MHSMMWQSSNSTVIMTDVDTLFTTKSLIEIAQEERRCKNELESAVEGVRQVVARRYRDMMLAADSIHQMTVNIKSVHTSIDQLREDITNVDSHQSQLASAFYRTSTLQYTNGDALRLLYDRLDGMLVDCVEEGQFVSAVWIVRLAEHIFSSHGSQLVDRPPRGDTIANAALLALSEDRDIKESILALSLLRDCPTHVVLKEYISLVPSLTSESSSLTKGERRARLSSIAVTLQSMVINAADTLARGGGELVESPLQSYFDPLCSHSIASLPKSMLNFSLHTPSGSVSEGDRRALGDSLRALIEVIDLPLDCVETLHEMVTVKKGVHQALETREEEYKRACDSLFDGRHLSLWETVYARVLDARVSDGVSQTIETSFAKYVSSVQSGSTTCAVLAAHPSLVLDAHAALRRDCQAVDVVIKEYNQAKEDTEHIVEKMLTKCREKWSSSLNVDGENVLLLYHAHSCVTSSTHPTTPRLLDAWLRACVDKSVVSLAEGVSKSRVESRDRHLVGEEEVYLPSSLSAPLHTSLHALCHCLQALPSHLLDKRALTVIAKHMSEVVVEAYKPLVGKKGDSLVLSALFDMHVLHVMLFGVATTSPLLSLATSLAESCDAFEMALARPLLVPTATNTAAQLHALYGICSLGGRGRGKASEQAHILPLAPSGSDRLPLLPVMMTSSAAIRQPISVEQKKGDDKGALADFYGKFSNNWFSG